MSLLTKIKSILHPIKVTAKDIEFIRNADWDTCAKWYLQLNSWGWPEELLPDDGSEKRENWSPTCKRNKLMLIITKKVGEKFLLRHHNVLSGRMTESEFEDFWNGEYEGDKEARNRYWERLYKPKA